MLRIIFTHQIASSRKLRVFCCDSGWIARRLAFVTERHLRPFHFEDLRMPRVAPSRVSAPIFPAFENQILIRKVAEPGGWLSNMSPHPIVYEGLKWWHAEALFQALRFAPDDEEAREAVREPSSPMKAKMIAKRFKARQVVAPLGDADVDNMRLCLHLKLAAHGELRRRLIASGERLLVEDCSARGRRVNHLFWGAVRVPVDADVAADASSGYAWEGRNILGRLWMEQRAMLQALNG
jgi:predicted NAD-dependent protein-ADP-ribosyltransferase YbiA (DUF1768 family)